MEWYELNYKKILEVNLDYDLRKLSEDFKM